MEPTPASSSIAPPRPGARYRAPGVEVTLLAYEPDGFSSVTSERLPDYSLEQLNLQANRLLSAEEITALRRESELLSRGAEQQMGVWNERRPLPCWFSQDRGVLTLGVSRRDYLTRRAAHTYWEHARVGVRAAVLDHLAQGGLTPLFAGTLGVHVTVETADGFFVLARRSSRARSYGGHHCLPIMEGAHDGDRVDGHLDATRTAVRGANEELGLAVTGADVVFHSLWVEHRTYGVVLQGHLDLRSSGLTFRDVKTSWATAQDAWEIDQLDPYPAASQAIDHLIASADPWLPWAQFAALLYRAWRWPGLAADDRPLDSYRLTGS